MKKIIVLILLISCFGLIIINQPVINKVENIKNTSWTITQYGNNNSKNQMMCYTIEGNENGLIIIDGGYENDDEILSTLENVILKHNNKVDAWILTHFDPDHAGAYIALRDKIPNLDVKKVYIQEMPDINLCKANATWFNNWELYEKYLKLNIENKQVVYSGDEINLIGLKMKVLSSYDTWVDLETDNILNNGSIVFKLYGNKESMLFCSDIQVKEIEEFLIKNYKEDLKSDYLQVPHHGNAWLSEEFYKLVNPKVALFDAPEALIKNYDNISCFTIDTLLEMFKNMETEVLYFKTAPNVIQLK